MAQLWINVPSRLKMTPAEHHAKPADSVPELATLGAGSTVRLYAGKLGGVAGPAPLPTPVLVAHVLLEPRGEVTIPVPAGWTASLCVVAGSIDSHGSSYNEGDTLRFADADADADADAVGRRRRSGSADVWGADRGTGRDGGRVRDDDS